MDCRKTLPPLQMPGKQEGETGGEERSSKSSESIVENRNSYLKMTQYEIGSKEKGQKHRPKQKLEWSTEQLTDLLMRSARVNELTVLES